MSLTCQTSFYKQPLDATTTPSTLNLQRFSMWVSRLNNFPANLHLNSNQNPHLTRPIIIELPKGNNARWVIICVKNCVSSVKMSAVKYILLLYLLIVTASLSFCKQRRVRSCFDSGKNALFDSLLQLKVTNCTQGHTACLIALLLYEEEGRNHLKQISSCASEDMCFFKKSAAINNLEKRRPKATNVVFKMDCCYTDNCNDKSRILKSFKDPVKIDIFLNASSKAIHQTYFPFYLSNLLILSNSLHW